jgi:hypothetical protein
MLRYLFSLHFCKALGKERKIYDMRRRDRFRSFENEVDFKVLRNNDNFQFNSTECKDN